MIGGVTFVIILLIVLFVFKPFSGEKKIQAFDAIPDNAFTVFRINNPGDLLINSNAAKIKKNLSVYKNIGLVLTDLQKTAQILASTSSFQHLLQSPLYISLHPAGNKTEVLYILELDEKADEDLLLEELNASGKISLTEKNIGGKTCYSFGKKPFFVQIYGNLVIGTASESLMASVVKTIDDQTGLSKNTECMAATQSAAKDCALNIFTNAPKLYKSLGLLFSDQTFSNLAFLETLTTWGNMDVRIKNDALVFSGLYPLKNKTASFMGLFDTPHKNATPEILAMLPANTASAFSYGFGEFNTFFSSYCSRMAKNQQNNYNHQSELDHLNEEAESESLEACLYENIAGQLCVFSTAEKPGLEPDVFCAFPVSDARAVGKCLSESAGDNTWDTVSYRGATLYNIPVEYGAYSLFGPLFEPIEETCIAVSGNFVYIGSSVAKLKTVLNNVLSGRTMGASGYNQAITNNIASSWNTFAFINTSQALYSLQNNWISDTTLIASLHAAKQNQQTGILSLTCTQQSNGIVVSGTWVFDSSDSTDASSWATTLDAELHGNPVVLSDPKTKEFWIAAADVYENLYLLNSEGMILWKINPGDAVRSDFQLLYPADPAKRCIAFTTRKGLYIVGMDGKMKTSFPVSVNSGITSNLLVVNYDNNQQYRFLFTDNDGVLHNYSIDGKPTKGWLKPELRQMGECRIFHRPLGGKDYLVVLHSGNGAEVFDRKGKRTFSVEGLFYNKGLPAFFAAPNGKHWWAVNTDGILVSVSTNGEVKTIGESSFGDNLLYTKAGNKMLVISDGFLFSSDASGKVKKGIALAESAVDDLKVLTSGTRVFLLFHTNEDVVGMTDPDGNYLEKALKTDAAGFDLINYKDQTILITGRGRVVAAEALELPETKNNKPE